MGADYLEQDVVATSDDQLVVLHDIHLDGVTDVAARFPERAREDGRYYVRDLTLKEIKTLRVHERCDENGNQVYPGRHKDDGSIHRVNSFAEELEFIDTLAEQLDRTVGIYPEIKKPAWHKEEGVDITPLFLQTLNDYGYDNYSDPVYVQCFDDRELRRIRYEFDCELKLIQLIGDNSWQEADTDYRRLCSKAGLQKLAETVDGIGPWLNLLYEVETENRLADTGVVAMAHAAGLAVHPYTFRQDELPPGFQSFDGLLGYVIDDLCVDGLFTDFPDVVLSNIGRF